MSLTPGYVAATKTIPVVFWTSTDPVEIGLVSSLNRPGGNLTGITTLDIKVATKRFELLHELVPAAPLIAVLLNANNRAAFELEKRELEAAARILGVRLLILNAHDPTEFDAAFATVLSERAGGLILGSDPSSFVQNDYLIALAARYRVPTVYRTREAALAGGLVSYGTDFLDVFRQVGVYTGRILKGEKPAHLPVQQVTKIQLIVNRRTAGVLGITFPETLLATADEVIE